MIRSLLACAAISCSVLALASPAEMSFEASDGVTVFGDFYASSDGNSAPTILLFHQAGGDARGEYAGIAARLVETGYNVLAIDQRSGGGRFGGVNRTAATLDNREFAYCDVYPDLDAALTYARTQGLVGDLAVWGSSYSAALVFQLAAKRGEEISAALAFSPASGGPLADCAPDQFIEDLSVPLLALRPQREYEIESVRAQMELFEAAGIQTHVADPGVHGSSMLVADRVEGDTEKTWAVVLAFLEETLTAE